MADELTIDVQSFGPDQAVLDELAAMILERGTLSETLGRNEHRLLSIEVLDEPGRKLAKPHQPQRFRENTDVVVWYGAHFTHDVNHEAPGEFGHVVGPELCNVNW